MRRLPFINFLLIIAVLFIAATGVPIGEGSASGYSLSYSTSETDTGMTWTDGKTIYTKVVDFGAMPNNTTKTVAHGITTINDVIRMDIMSQLTDDFIPFSYASGLNPRCFVEEPNIKCVTTSNFSSYSAWFILYYTKQ